MWYTPREVVQYMVARVETVLREELGITRGLADPHVYVLDPCCGTGAYLVEVLRKIAETLRADGGDARLSYREKELLGRDLTPEEARYVTEMVRRIAAIIALGPSLDENSERGKADTYAWPRE